MKKSDIISQKILPLSELARQSERWRFLNKTVAFTNGCFDILHQGHIFSLAQAALEADYLIVGLNDDSSVRRLKGAGRPINHVESRALVLASLFMVDAVVVFEEDTPLALIRALTPNVLIKGGDYTVDEIVGAGDVIASGGRVVINPILEGFSTSALIEKIHRL
ncbi:MAG TPA: D-glycero-beta-D-manno-heptose 1-phosphate adenylyltransferase [Puia sp.]|nr:D-glycero-beta-D-manno-heptose 1-phosphate adenylyltransferase [Puia sp.]